MFWSLLLAHFIADFPLQPNWMVKAKRTNQVLILHVGVHLITMILISGIVRVKLWPFLLLIALIHFAIDYGKNEVQRLRPSWVVLPYITDQFLHYISIFLVTLLIQNRFSQSDLPSDNNVFVFASGYLIATYVWFITERIIFYADQQYRQELNIQYWPRMVLRALFLTFFLWGINIFSSSVAFLVTIVHIPYLSGRYALRTFLTDLTVSVVVMLLIRLAI